MTYCYFFQMLGNLSLFYFCSKLLFVRIPAEDFSLPNHFAGTCMQSGLFPKPKETQTSLFVHYFYAAGTFVCL